MAKMDHEFRASARFMGAAGPGGPGSGIDRLVHGAHAIVKSIVTVIFVSVAAARVTGSGWVGHPSRMRRV